MKGQKKVVVQVSRKNIRLMERWGLSPQDVFYKGFEDILREKYAERCLVDDDDEDEWECEWDEVPGQLDVMRMDRFYDNDDDLDDT